MKPVDLATLAALHADSTPGEWTYIAAPVDDDSPLACAVDRDVDGIDEDVDGFWCIGPSSDSEAQAHADARFIAAAHNAFPAMAAELRAWREVDKARQDALDASVRLEAALAKVPR